jgi:hypothetical protein
VTAVAATTAVLPVADVDAAVGFAACVVAAESASAVVVVAEIVAAASRVAVASFGAKLTPLHPGDHPVPLIFPPL